jgi:hypothetical protein
MRKRFLLAGIAVAIGVAAIAIVALVVFRGSGHPTLSTVSDEQLARVGIRLVKPVGGPVIGPARAESAAVAQFHGKAREAVLATVSAPRGPLVDGCLCWVVSVLPRVRTEQVGGVQESPTLVAIEYLVVFVNARTGTFVFATASYGPAPPTPR